jgi:hypothetical protein
LLCTGTLALSVRPYLSGAFDPLQPAPAPPGAVVPADPDPDDD